MVRPGQWHRAVLVLGTAVALALVSLPGQVAAGDGASAGTLRLDLSSTSVDQGATFTVHVVQNAPIATSGAAATVVFDKSKLQIQSVVRGQAFASAPILAPSDMNGTIATANTSGKLLQVGAGFLPPNTVAAGDQLFLDITFKATGCGQVAISLPVDKTGAQILDGTEANWGYTLKVTTSGGSVTIGNCNSNGGSQQANGATAGSQATPASAGDQSPAAGNGGNSSAASDPPAGAQPVQQGVGDGTQGGANASPIGGSSGSGGSPPLWVPILAAIPAVALIWLGLRKWRLGSAAPRRSW